MRRHALVVLVVGLCLLAGCSGSSGPVTPTERTNGTATPDGAPDGTVAPPGATGAGLNATRLVDAHLSALGDRFAVRLTERDFALEVTTTVVTTRYGPDERLYGREHRRSDAAPERSAFYTTTAGENRTLRRHSVGDRMRYYRVPPARAPGSPDDRGFFTHARQLRDLVAAGAFERVDTVRRGGERVAVYRATGANDERAEADLVGSNRALINATLHVTDDGLVRRASYNVSTPYPAVATVRFRLLAAANARVEPRWLDTARERAVVATRTVPDNESHVAIAVRAGEPLPAGATVSYSGERATLSEPVRPGETLYVSNCGGDLAATVGAPKCDGPLPARGGLLTIRVDGAVAYETTVPVSG